MENKDPFQQEELAYDLRQGYARLVGDHLIDVAYYRKEKNYPNYFRSLEDLYTIVSHKIKNKENELKKKDKDKFKNYEDLKKEFIKIANEYPDAYCFPPKDTHPEHIGKIENSLRIIERYLYSMMDEAKMFGGKRDAEGLG